MGVGGPAVERQWVGVERAGVILNEDAWSRRFGRHGGHGHVGGEVGLQGHATAGQLKRAVAAGIAQVWRARASASKACSNAGQVYADAHRPRSCRGN
jgi:hypothetical protein